MKWLRRIGLTLVAILAACSPVENDAQQKGPAQVKLGATAGECRPTIDGTAVSFDELARLVRQWDGTETEILFVPDPKVQYECFDRILTELRKAKRLNLGFVGNEQYRTDQQ